VPGDLEVLRRLEGIPGVPRVVGLCSDAWGRDALMTAPVGEVLEWRVWDEQSVSPAPLHTLVGGLVRALQSSHSRGVINRDIRPSNIVFASKQAPQQLVIIDWGFAVQCEDGARCFEGPYSGTIPYASDWVLKHYAYAQSMGGDVVVCPEDDLVSLVRCAFAVVHPSARMKLRLLDRGGAAAVLSWWQDALAFRPGWRAAVAAAERGDYAGVERLLPELME
jgi:hypothetical protein